MSSTQVTSGLGDRQARERIINRRTLRREQFRAVLGDDHVVLEANAELAGDVDAWLVGQLK